MKRIKKEYVLILKLFFLVLVLSFVLFFGERQYEYITSSPYDVIISDISNSSAIVSWKTRRDVPTYILLSSTEILGNGVREKFHRVIVEDLEEETDYTFSISNGKRTWDSAIYETSDSLRPFVTDGFKFVTAKEKDDLVLPSHSSLILLPHELVYVTLFDGETGEYSDVRSTYANRYGGAVFVKENFLVDEPSKYSIKNINYFSSSSEEISLIPKVFAAEINCNQNIPYLPSNAISREAFAGLANRWVSGRGKNYAYECYNDVIYRAKKAGVDPAFVLTMWLKESGASNYTWNPDAIGTIEDFGIHGKRGIPVENFDKQIEYFLTLGHDVNCTGLSKWEAWGNYYRYGTCNSNDPIQRADGIDYYKDVATLYSWITNGSRLPDFVTGNTKIKSIPEEIYQQKCCALKLEGSETLLGVFRNNVGTKRCESLFPRGTSLQGYKVEYSILLETEKSQKSCETNYGGVCCRLNNELKWYPTYLCDDILTDITNSKACNDYKGERACFFRDGKYQWLPKILANDNLEGVNSSALCLERNNISTYTIDLSKGINFVGFDFSPLKNGKALSASDILEIYPDISLVANFQNYEWIDIIVDSEGIPFAGKDFEVLQNSGYLLISDRALTISLDGWTDSNLGMKKLDEGWTLVGGSIYTEYKDASSLISMLKEKGFEIDTVALWSNELSSFIYRRELDKKVYGENIAFPSNVGFFLRLND